MDQTWSPTVKDVANVIPRRATGEDGLAEPSFTVDTVPTDRQVEGIIRSTVQEVAGAVTVPTDLYDMATAVAAVGAASYVELGFYPEQSDGGGPGQQLWDRYQTGLARLAAAIDRTVTGPDSVAEPVYSFPCAPTWPSEMA